MRKLTKIPIINDNKEIVGYEAPEKQIKILVCNKKDADGFQLKYLFEL